jgi:hypothetical protein
LQVVPLLASPQLIQELEQRLLVVFTGQVSSCFLAYLKHSINTDTYTRTGTHPYEYMHAHITPMSTSERLSRLDLEIHEVGHQEHLDVDGDVVSY